MASRKTVFLYRGVVAPPEAADWTRVQRAAFCAEVDKNQAATKPAAIRCARHDVRALARHGQWWCPHGHCLGTVRG